MRPRAVPRIDGAAMIIRALSRFCSDRKANIAITFAFAMIPTIFLAGMTIDYISATRKQAKLDALADGAALAALTPPMLHAQDSVAQQAAQDFFNAQAPSITGLNYNTSNGLTVTITDTLTTRSVSVKYTASSQNNFPGILNSSSIALSGTSQASASFPPNIDFYLLLDNSPSMAIAATSAGITTMVNNTSAQGGCAFACHESDPQGENPPLNNKNLQGKVDNTIDNYQLAKNLNVTTRIQLVASAVSQLATTAASTATQNKATYRMAIYTFNYQGTQTIASLSSNLSNVGSQAQNIDVMEVYKNNWLTSTNNNSDADTDFGQAMSDMINIMPAPGTGLSGSKPQEVLFIVSDGIDDVNNPSPSCSEPLSGSRCQQMFNTSWCTQVKNSNIRIAVLYTVYLPMTTNSWYNSWIAPFQDYTTSNDNVATNMKNCASPGLYTSVTTDGDIAAALNNLFQQAVQIAHLTQ
jgi:Flp pilus assembly protein TadG